MKITEKRECCEPQDLLPLRCPMRDGLPDWTQRGAKFCKHCGQVWILCAYNDAAGGTSHELRRLVIKEAETEGNDDARKNVVT